VELLYERCAALDIGKKDLKACVRTPKAGRGRSRRQEIRTFATTTNALLELRDWLVTEKVTLVVMEATGDYWRGAFYLLEDELNVILVNAAHAKGLPGRKTDVSDAAWLCQMGECGLLKASFVPPEPIRHLRDLTRYRTTLRRAQPGGPTVGEGVGRRRHQAVHCGHRHPRALGAGDADRAHRRGT
jgi:transposase